MIELIKLIPFEIKIIVLAGIFLMVLELFKTNRLNGVNKNADTINPFSLTTRLNGKTIKQMQEVNKNDRQRTNTTSNR